MLWSSLLCNYISTEWERGKKEREIAESAFFCRSCLVKHGYYESINRHYDTVLFHSFTTPCQSLNGDITATLFKSHIQYLLFSPLQQERNVNKPYNPHRALSPCHCTAGFILAFVRQHMGSDWNSGPWSQVNFLFIFAPVHNALVWHSAAYVLLCPRTFSDEVNVQRQVKTCKQVIIAAFKICKGTSWMFISIQ